MLRITAGSYKGRSVVAAASIRPTSERVREAVFNILGEYIHGKAVLELCAGSGVFGLEALSRGAASCVFVDNNRQCVKNIHKNIHDLDTSLEEVTEVICADALKAIKTLSSRGYTFDIIFLDPPYASGLYKNSLIYIGDYAILNPNGFLILEHSKKDTFAQPSDFKEVKSRIYGDTALSFYVPITQ